MASMSITTTRGTYPDTPMTSNSSNGFSALASSEYAVGNAAWKAFDLNSTTSWISSYAVSGDRWIQLSFSDGGNMEVTSVTLTPRTGELDRMPRDFSIQTSYTGAFTGEEVTIYSTTGMTWADTTPVTITI